MIPLGDTKKTGKKWKDLAQEKNSTKKWMESRTGGKEEKVDGVRKKKKTNSEQSGRNVNKKRK